MTLFILILEWPLSPPATAMQSFKTWLEARKWQRLCEAICGKNDHGEPFTRSTLQICNPQPPASSLRPFLSEPPRK